MTEPEMMAVLKASLDLREWAIIPQVRNQTGYSRTVRTADAIAVSLWPSKGITVHGYEFKDSRADFLRELKDGSKSEEIGRYCHYWTILTSDAAHAKVEEIPEMWGLVSVVDGAVKVRKKAPYRNAEEPSRVFFASLIRAASQATPEADVERRIAEAVAAEKKRAWRDHEKWREEQRKKDADENRLASAKIAAFESATGVKIERFYRDDAARAGKIGEAVKFIMDGGLKFESIEYARNHVSAMLRDIDAVLAELRANNPTPQPTEAADGG